MVRLKSKIPETAPASVIPLQALVEDLDEQVQRSGFPSDVHALWSLMSRVIDERHPGMDGQWKRILIRRIALSYVIPQYTAYVLGGPKDKPTIHHVSDKISITTAEVIRVFEGRIESLRDSFDPLREEAFFMEVAGSTMAFSGWEMKPNDERSRLRMEQGMKTSGDVMRKMTIQTVTALVAREDFDAEAICAELANQRRICALTAMDQIQNISRGGAYKGRLPISHTITDGKVRWTFNRASIDPKKIWTGCPAHTNMAGSRSTMDVFDYLLPQMQDCIRLAC